MMKLRVYSLVLCESASMVVGTRDANIRGAFFDLKVSGAPTGPIHLYLYMEFGGTCPPETILRIVVRTQESPVPLWLRQIKVGVHDASLAGVIDFGDVTFPKLGGYFVDVYAGADTLLAQRPFSVVLSRGE